MERATNLPNLQSRGLRFLSHLFCEMSKRQTRPQILPAYKRMAKNTTDLESLLKACGKGLVLREMVNSLEMSLGCEGMLLKWALLPRLPFLLLCFLATRRVVSSIIEEPKNKNMEM